MSLDLYFAGAEVPTWRKLLVAEGVTHVCVNYLHLRPRLGKRPWRLEDHFPEEVSVFLDSGAAGTRRRHWTAAEHSEYLAEYVSFVNANIERVTYFTEYDATDMGLDWIEQQRLDAWTGMSFSKIVPVWHEEHGAPTLRTMVQFFPNLGVPALSDQAENALGSLIRGSRIALHGLGFSHPWDVPGGLYSTVVSSSWISPTRYGETQVWDTNRLRRHPAEDKEKIRRRYRSKFTQAGFDAAKILADDNAEVSRYTIWCWKQLEAHLVPPERAGTGQRVTLGDGNGHLETAPERTAAVVIEPEAAQGNGSHLPAEIKRLPVFNMQLVRTETTGPDGETVTSATEIAVMGKGGLRQCSSCSLAAVCPEYSAGASCSYEIPIEIRNRDQLVSILNSLLEMQAQRVGFGFFAEQLSGGYPDANLSSELDRFMRMTQAVKEIQDSRDFLKVTVEGRAQSGVLRRLFGGERAEALHRVDADRAENAVRRTMGS